jgi:hypothetical protein
MTPFRGRIMSGVVHSQGNMREETIMGSSLNDGSTLE